MPICPFIGLSDLSVYRFIGLSAQAGADLSVYRFIGLSAQAGKNRPCHHAGQARSQKCDCELQMVPSVNEDGEMLWAEDIGQVSATVKECMAEIEANME